MPEAALIKTPATTHTYGGAFTEDDSRAMTGGAEGEVRVWDMQEGFIIKSLVHPETVETMAISPDGQTIVTGSTEVRVWRMPELGGGVQQWIGSLRGHKGDARVVMFAPHDSGPLLTIGAKDNTVRVWDIAHFLKVASGKSPEPSLDELRKQARPPAAGSRFGPSLKLV